MSVPLSYYLNSPELKSDASPSSPVKSTSRTTTGIDVSLLPLIPTHNDITDLKSYLHGEMESKTLSRLRKREMRRQLRARTNDETLRQPGYTRHHPPKAYATGSGSEYISRSESSFFYAGQSHSFSMPSLVRTVTASPQPLSRTLTPTPQVVSVDPQRSASKQNASSPSNGLMRRMTRSRSASTLSFRKWRVKNKSTPNVDSQPLDSGQNSPYLGPRVQSPMLMVNGENVGPDTSISTAPSVNSFDLSLSPTSSHQLSSHMDQRSLVSPVPGGDVPSDSFSSMLASECDTPHIPQSNSPVPSLDNVFSNRHIAAETNIIYPQRSEEPFINRRRLSEKQSDAKSDLHIRTDAAWPRDAPADSSTTESMPLPTTDPTTWSGASSQPSYDAEEVSDLRKKSQGLKPMPVPRVVKLDQTSPSTFMPKDSLTQDMSDVPIKFHSNFDMSKPLPELEAEIPASETAAWPLESDNDASIATSNVEEGREDVLKALPTRAHHDSGGQAQPQPELKNDPFISIYSGISSQSSPTKSLSSASQVSDSNYTLGRKDSIEATTQCAPAGIDDMLLAALNIASETPSTSSPSAFAPFERDLSPAATTELPDNVNHQLIDSRDRGHSSSSLDNPTDEMAPRMEEFQAQQASLRGTIESSKAEILQLREKIQAFRVEVSGDSGSLNDSHLNINLPSLSPTQERRLRDSLVSMDDLDQRLSEMLEHHASVN